MELRTTFLRSLHLFTFYVNVNMGPAGAYRYLRSYYCVAVLVIRSFWKDTLRSPFVVHRWYSCLIVLRFFDLRYRSAVAVLDAFVVLHRIRTFLLRLPSPFWWTSFTPDHGPFRLFVSGIYGAVVGACSGYVFLVLFLFYVSCVCAVLPERARVVVVLLHTRCSTLPFTFAVCSRCSVIPFYLLVVTRSADEPRVYRSAVYYPPFCSAAVLPCLLVAGVAGVLVTVTCCSLPGIHCKCDYFCRYRCLNAFDSFIHYHCRCILRYGTGTRWNLFFDNIPSTLLFLEATRPTVPNLPHSTTLEHTLLEHSLHIWWNLLTLPLGNLRTTFVPSEYILPVAFVVTFVVIPSGILLAVPFVRCHYRTDFHTVLLFHALPDSYLLFDALF